MLLGGIIMFTILENDISRKLLILDVLYCSDRYISIDEMITIANCTRKTLSKDLVTINEKQDVIEYHREKGLFYNKTKGVNFHFFYCTYLKESLYVEILRLILIEELTVVSMSRKLFISESKTRRIIEVWNQYFSERDFSFAIKTSGESTILLGDETQIRWFSHIMLFELSFIEIYDCEIQEKQEYLTYRTLLKDTFFDADIKEYECKRSFFYAQAALYRIKKGHRDHNRDIYLSFDNEEKTETLREFEELMSIETGVKFNLCIKNQLIPKYYFPDLCSKTDEPNLTMKKIVEDIVETLEIDKVDMTAELTRIIAKMTHLYNYEPTATYFLLDFIGLNYQKQKKNHYHFNKTVDRIFKDNNMVFPNRKRKQIFYRELVFLLNTELDLQKYILRRPVLAVYVFASESMGDAMVNLLRIYFGGRIELHVTDDIDEKLIHSDLILSNYLLPKELEGKKVHFLEAIDLNWLHLLDSKLTEVYNDL